MTRAIHPGAVVGALCLFSLGQFYLMADPSDVLTFHNDMARTGQTLHEQILAVTNVNASHFGKLWVLPTDDKVLAQPLYAAGISIPGLGMRNVLFIESENDTAYAYDADSTEVLWQTSLAGFCEQPYQTEICTIKPQLGVTATPVIDRQYGANGAIFIQAMSEDLWATRISACTRWI